MATTKLLVPIEQVKKSLKQSLKSNDIDQELIAHYLAAQSWAERYCRRGFDGEKSETEYFSGNRTHFINLKNFPILSLSELNIDNSRNFAATTAVDSTGYWIKNELGEIGIASNWVALSINGWNFETDGGKFPKGEDNIKVTYKGGFIPEKAVVAAAAKAASHTIADNLLSYGVAMYVFVKTSGSFTAAGAGIAITGLDDNGTSFTENIVPNITDATALTPTISYATSHFTKITAVDSSALTGTGTVSVTAVSAPIDLRHALCILTNHLFKVDTQSRIGVKQRSTQGTSVTLDAQTMPPLAKQILDLYKTILF